VNSWGGCVLSYIWSSWYEYLEYMDLEYESVYIVSMSIVLDLLRRLLRQIGRFTPMRGVRLTAPLHAAALPEPSKNGEGRGRDIPQ